MVDHARKLDVEEAEDQQEYAERSKDPRKPLAAFRSREKWQWWRAKRRRGFTFGKWGFDYRGLVLMLFGFQHFGLARQEQLGGHDDWYERTHKA